MNDDRCRRYQRYLLSASWQQTRLRKLRVHGVWLGFENYVKCDQCNQFVNARRADVHHRHYNSLGHESLADLLILCQNCHKQIHKRPIPVDEACISSAELVEEFWDKQHARPWEPIRPKNYEPAFDEPVAAQTEMEF